MLKELWSGVFTVKTLPNQIITDTARLDTSRFKIPGLYSLEF